MKNVHEIAFDTIHDRVISFSNVEAIFEKEWDEPLGCFVQFPEDIEDEEEVAVFVNFEECLTTSDQFDEDMYELIDSQEVAFEIGDYPVTLAWLFADIGEFVTSFAGHCDNIWIDYEKLRSHLKHDKIEELLEGDEDIETLIQNGDINLHDLIDLDSFLLCFYSVDMNK
jgi:hypothetical protein